MRKKIIEYYQKHYNEQGRLERPAREIEFERTIEIINRYLPKKPIRILDIGRGAGIYSAWLAKLGHNVCLIDFVPLHIEQARETAKKTTTTPFYSGSWKCYKT